MKNDKTPLASLNQYLEGKLEILVHKAGVLLERQELKNIILYQGQAELLRSIYSIAGRRIFTRMAIGDQGTIPSDSTVPKITNPKLKTLFHEVYRKDFELIQPTLYSETGYTYVGNTTEGSNLITGMATTSGLTLGMLINGTGIPQGTVISKIVSPTSIQMSAKATSSNSAALIQFSGVVNEVRFVCTFSAADVPISAFSNPAQPRVNEVGLVIIDPSAPEGAARPPVIAPAPSAPDEILGTIRTFKSVPFEAAEDITITIRYTIYTE